MSREVFDLNNANGLFVTNAPCIKCIVYGVPLSDSPALYKECDFYLDTGADEFAAIPYDTIMEVGGKKTGETITLVDFEENRYPKDIYAVSLKIDRLELNETVEAIISHKPYCILPRKIMSEWKIEISWQENKLCITPNE